VYVLGGHSVLIINGDRTLEMSKSANAAVIFLVPSQIFANRSHTITGISETMHQPRESFRRRKQGRWYRNTAVSERFWLRL